MDAPASLVNPSSTYKSQTMSFPASDRQNQDPTSNSAPILTGRSASNFYVTPMGNGRPAKVLEKSREDEEDPMAGIGFSIMGSVIGGALGLGPLFEIGLEALKGGIEVSDAKPGSRDVAMDVNLNPAAQIRPDLAFNFRSLPSGKPSKQEEEEAAKAEAEKSKRSWNSGEGSFLKAQMDRKRAPSMGAGMIPRMKGFATSASR